MDEIAAQETGPDSMDEKNHLAKVRVAGSNPVVRSRKSPGRAVRGVETGLSWRVRDGRAPHLHHIFWSFSGFGPLTLCFCA